MRSYETLDEEAYAKELAAAKEEEARIASPKPSAEAGQSGEATRSVQPAQGQSESGPVVEDKKETDGAPAVEEKAKPAKKEKKEKKAKKTKTAKKEE